MPPSMVSTLAGISIVVKAVQSLKTAPPDIDFNCVPSSKVTLVKEEQLSNMPSPIVSTLAGISIVVKAVQFLNTAPALSKSFVIDFNCDPFSKVTFTKEEQSENMEPLSSVTFLGILILVKLLQYANAFVPISVIVSGKLILIKLQHS